MLTAAQIRAARALLNWNLEDLATATGLTSKALVYLERGLSRPHQATLDRLLGTFLEHGIIFTEDDGVRRQRTGVHVYDGREGFKSWIDDVYETIKNGGEISVTGCKESDYTKWLTEDEDRRHTERMRELGGKLRCRVILAENDFDFYCSSYVTYRWIPKERWDRNPLYIYGHKVAVIEFSEDRPKVTVIESPGAARSFKKMFETMWETCRDVPARRKV